MPQDGLLPYDRDDDVPAWINGLAVRQPHAGSGGQYESGNPEEDAFLRKRGTVGPDEDEPFPGAYEDPGEARRMLIGAFRAGQSGDRQAMDQLLNGPYADSEFGQLMKRAYQEGMRSRGGRQPTGY